MMTTPSSRAIEALESRIAPATLLGLDTTNNLLVFDSATPGFVAETIAVTGLGVGETLIGIDFRPADGFLYGITKDGSNAGRLYNIAPDGSATLRFDLVADAADVTDPYTALSGASFGLDFNPFADRLRVTSDAEQNLRINVDTGLVTTDSALNPAGEVVGASAYTNNFAGAPSTTLYNIGTSGTELLQQAPPNNGTLVSIGALGGTLTSPHAGFDIIGTSTTGLAALEIAGVTGLYSVDTTTGAATFVGKIGAGSTDITGLAAIPGSLRLVNAKTATFNDVDGDLVTVKVTVGSLGLSNFVFGPPNALGGFELQELDISDAEFGGANVTINAKRSALGGDGFVNVGGIDASGNNLGNVKVNGDLGFFESGDGTEGAIAATKLDVYSLGLVNNLDDGDFPAEILLNGSLTALKVRTQIESADISIGGAVSTVTIGGDVDELFLEVNGAVGKMTVGGEVFESIIEVEGGVTKLTLGNDLYESDLAIGGALGKAKIGGQMIFSSIYVAGNVNPIDNVAALAVDQLTIRGAVNESSILIGYDVFTEGSTVFPTAVEGDVKVNKITIGGNFRESTIAVGTADGAVIGDNSEAIVASIASLVIKGQAFGSNNSEDAFAISAEEIVAFKVGATKPLLTAGPSNDDFPLGFTGNLRVTELSQPVVV